MLCHTALRVLLSTSIMPFPHLCAGCEPQSTALLCAPGWPGVPFLRLTKCSSVQATHCHLRSLFPGPPPYDENNTKSPKNMENIPLFHIWKTEGPGATGGHWVVRPVAIESSLTQYLISLAPLGLHFKVSVVLFHPVPAFITVLPVLFSFNNLSVAPTEEAHLPEKHS